MKKLFAILVLICGVVSGGVKVGIAWADDGEIAEETQALQLYIKAVNPGYTIDGQNNVGEMIEIGRKGDSDAMISLAGIKIDYTNSSGNTTTLWEFPEQSFIAGENILLRLASSPGSELAAGNYTKTLAMKGGIALMRGEEVVDSVCWTGKDECYKEFKSASPTTLVRNINTGEFEHVKDYEPVYNEKNYHMEIIPDEGYGGVSQCKGMVFSEILSYYETSQSEQFIELHNTAAEQILLNGCQIKYKNKLYPLDGIVKADEFYVRYLNDFSLTKDPTSSNTLELVDTDGEIVAKMSYPNGQRKGTSYVLVGYDEGGREIWRVTYAPTPGSANNYQEYKSCEAGKVLNEVTGNCVKVTSVTEKVCAEGQYLNLLTGRCRKIPEVSSGVTVCKEGYYYYEPTGRCRKIQENNGTEYSLETQEYEESSSFVALYAILGVAGVGLVYVVYEFRYEIWRLVRKVWRRFR